MKKYAYLGTNEDLAEKFASVLHDLVCSDDMIEDRRLGENAASDRRSSSVLWKITDIYATVPCSG